MAQYGYGQQENPFDQRGNGYGGGYPGPQSPPMGGNGYDNYGSNNVEMSSLAQNAGSFGGANNTLNEVSEINNGINDIDRNLEQLKMLHTRALDDSDSSAGSATARQLDALSSETMALYRSLTDRVRHLKSNPESQAKFGQQVRRVDTRLKNAIQDYQKVESDYRKRAQEQMARQYRIVRPDADEEEVRAAVEDQNGGQIFQQAMMQSNRRGQAQAVLSAVQDRHAQLQKIEQQMMELAQLFQDMDTLVMQQDTHIANIEQKGEEVVDNLDKGNVEIGTAVNTARATRKKKWICLGVIVAIIVIIVIIVVVYFLIKNPPSGNSGGNGGGNGGGNAQKRSILQPTTRSWLETEGVPQLLTSRINHEARRWLAEGNRLPGA
ncbi:t-SNARE [Xylariomycetidae sp. FL0641]|nr:t-SNARE [Xylariomycetidae sp. FL0641]